MTLKMKSVTFCSRKTSTAAYYFKKKRKKGVPARNFPGFCLIFEHEMCKHGVKSVTVSLNRCNKQDQYMYQSTERVLVCV